MTVFFNSSQNEATFATFCVELFQQAAKMVSLNSFLGFGRFDAFLWFFMK